MSTITIDHPHNEASALIGVQNRRLLDARGWDLAFWTVSDEKDGCEALAALGRRADNGEWEIVPLRMNHRDGGPKKATEDCETLARAGSWVYVFGSQYGAKGGPLEPKRHFVIRFNEALIDAEGDEIHTRIDLARRPFFLHRLINDAIRDAGLELRDPHEKLREAFVGAAKKRGDKAKKKWCELVRDNDMPVNIEGSTFLPGGHLLLGLRYPSTREGNPILVEIEGLDRYFEEDMHPPEVVGLRVIANVGAPDCPAGIRELDYMNGVVHLITGSVDSRPDKSLLVQTDEGNGRAPNEHWVAGLRPGEHGVCRIEARRVRQFNGEGMNVEGIAIAGDHIWYAYDHEKIVLEVADLVR